MDRIDEQPGSARVVARSDVLVVGGGPAGFAAAIAAKREGCSVTLIERYPYLGGLASGGMVLVLDDMHNGEEITVTGLCMEIIERMAKVGAAVYPPPEDRGQSWEKYRKWARWGCHDFRAQARTARRRPPAPGAGRNAAALLVAPRGAFRPRWVEARLQRNDYRSRRER